MGSEYEKHDDECFGRVVHNPWFDLLVVFLLLLDVGLVAYELGVELQVVCVGGKVVPAPETPHYRLLRELPGAEVSAFLASNSDMVTVSADGHGKKEILQCYAPSSKEVHDLEHNIRLASIGILTFFAIELALKIYLLPGFLNNCLHKLDVFVVYVSLTFDLIIFFFLSGGSEGTRRGISADIIVAVMLLTRFWRVVRIVHGLFLVSEKHVETKVEEMELKHAEEHKTVDEAAAQH